MNYKDIEDLMKLIDYLRYKKESDNSSSIRCIRIIISSF